jgi:hypothetical protein
MVGTDFMYELKHRLLVCPEASIGVNNSHAQWAANLATDTWYATFMNLKSRPVVFMRQDRVSRHSPGFVDQKYQKNHGYLLPGKMSISGELLDCRYLLKALCTVCTTDQWGYTHNVVASIAAGGGTNRAYTMTATDQTITLNALAGLTCTVNGHTYTIASNTAVAGLTAVVITMTTDGDAGDATHDMVINQYRHRYLTSTARSLPSATPTFALFDYLENDVAAESVYKIYHGCIISKATITGPIDGEVTATIEVEFANVVTGIALNSVPAPVTYATYHSRLCTYTLTKGGSAYLCKKGGFALTYDDGKALFKGSAETYPVSVRFGYRKITLSLTIYPIELLPLTDITGLDPATANTLIIGTKIYRDAYQDFLNLLITNAALVDGTDLEWENALGKVTLTYEISASESGTFLFEEVNTYTSTQY